jgi:hypothetical protein
MSDTTTCPKCGARGWDNGNRWVCGTFQAAGGGIVQADKCKSQQADPPKEPGVWAKCAGCFKCGRYLHDCNCTPTTVTNAAGEKQSEAVAYPLVKVKVTRGVDIGNTFYADIYDIISAVECKNVAHAQALKKLMRGGRDGKDWQRDMKEAADSIQRALEMET